MTTLVAVHGSVADWVRRPGKTFAERYELDTVAREKGLTLRSPNGWSGATALGAGWPDSKEAVQRIREQFEMGGQNILFAQSNGTGIATRVALEYPAEVGAVICLGGLMLDRHLWRAPQCTVPTLWVTGGGDNVVPKSEAFGTWIGSEDAVKLLSLNARVSGPDALDLIQPEGWAEWDRRWAGAETEAFEFVNPINETRHALWVIRKAWHVDYFGKAAARTCVEFALDRMGEA